MTNDKLPVFEYVGKALATGLSPRVIGTLFFWKCFILLFVISETCGFFVVFLGRFLGATGSTFELLTSPIAQLLMLIPFTLFFAPVAVKIHRGIILGEPLPNKPFSKFFSKRNMTFFRFALLFSLPIVLADTLPKLFVDYLDALSWWILYSILIYIFVLVRVVLIFPYLAISDQWAFSHCWSLTKGNNWRLFWANLIVGIIGYFISKLALVTMQWVLETGFPVYWLWADLINTFLLLFYVVVTVALVSHWFLFFQEREPLVKGSEPAYKETLP